MLRRCLHGAGERGAARETKVRRGSHGEGQAGRGCADRRVAERELLQRGVVRGNALHAAGGGDRQRGVKPPQMRAARARAVTRWGAPGAQVAAGDVEAADAGRVGEPGEEAVKGLRRNVVAAPDVDNLGGEWMSDGGGGEEVRAEQTSREAP